MRHCYRSRLRAFVLCGRESSTGYQSVNFAQDKTSGGSQWNSRLDQPETAGVVPVENWNNLDVLSGTQEIPEELFLNDGSLSGATVI